MFKIIFGNYNEKSDEYCNLKIEEAKKAEDFDTFDSEIILGGCGCCESPWVARWIVELIIKTLEERGEKMIFEGERK